jgi:pyruvate,water dikinase
MNKKPKNILRGIAASPAGRIQGRVRVVKSLEGFKNLSGKTILVSPFLTPDFVAFLNNPNILGIITNEGCSTCHAAIVARELRIPYIAAAADATKKLKNNALVTMDSDRGIIYEA